MSADTGERAVLYLKTSFLKGKCLNCSWDWGAGLKCIGCLSATSQLHHIFPFSHSQVNLQKRPQEKCLDRKKLFPFNSGAVFLWLLLPFPAATALISGCSAYVIFCAICSSCLGCTLSDKQILRGTCK